MPDGCLGVFWANVAELRKINPVWLKKAIGPGFGVRAEDIDRITVGWPAWPTAKEIDIDSDFQFCDVSHAVAMIVVPQRVTALEAKEQIEKNLGSLPWREETIQGVTLHVQESDKPIAFFQPAKQTIVIGPAKLVREVLVRGTRAQLPGKLAATWAGLDQSHAIGLMMGPPPAGDPAQISCPTTCATGLRLYCSKPTWLRARTFAFAFPSPASTLASPTRSAVYARRSAKSPAPSIRSLPTLQNPCNSR